MKPIRTSLAVALVLSCATLVVSSAQTLVKVTIKADHYESSGGETMEVVPVTAADFVSACTAESGASLVAIVDDVESNIVGLATVDTCGNILCTNIIISTLCDQVAISSNGKSETSTIAAHDELFSPDGVYTGGGFLLSTGLASPTNSTAISTFSAKGTFTLCKTNTAVITGTITIKTLFKPGKGCS